MTDNGTSAPLELVLLAMHPASHGAANDISAATVPTREQGMGVSLQCPRSGHWPAFGEVAAAARLEQSETDIS